MSNRKDAWTRKILVCTLRAEQSFGVSMAPDVEEGWKAHVAQKLLSATSPPSKFNSLDADYFKSPHRLGALVGVKQSTLNLFKERLPIFLERYRQGKLTYVEILRLRYHGIHETMIPHAVDWYLRDQFHVERRAISRSWNIALSEAGPDLRPFAKGFYESVERFVFEEKGIVAGENSATPIYRFLFAWGELCQERLHSIAELHLLLRSLYPSQVVGDQERIKQLCKRVEFRIASQGRPKGKRDIEEIRRSLFKEVREAKAVLDEDIIRANKNVHAEAGSLKTRGR